ncbi:minor capsid protein [Capybara microvirus Cap3_SP_330]|nr:minor capsid protein [Capybara microvirus Cap3_SP_330]
MSTLDDLLSGVGQGLANAASTAVSSPISIGANALSQQIAYNQNVRLMDRQNLLRRQQWQREIDYQSPANQMRLYKEAGLNPNMVLGNNVGLPSTPELSSGSPMAMPAVSPSAALNSVEVQNLQADTELKRSSMDNLRKKTSWIDSLNESQLGLNQAEIDVLAQNLVNLQITAENLAKDGVLKDITIDRERVAYELDVALKDIKINTAQAEYAKILKDIELIAQQIKESVSQTALNYREMALIDKKIEMCAKEMEKMDVDIALSQLQLGSEGGNFRQDFKPKTDDNGQPITDDNGNVVYRPTFLWWCKTITSTLGNIFSGSASTYHHSYTNNSK